jgi:hypothetical protein
LAQPTQTRRTDSSNEAKLPIYKGALLHRFGVGHTSYRPSDRRWNIRVPMREQTPAAGLIPVGKSRGTAMKIAKMILAATFSVALISAALAQQSLTGTVTQIDRINGTVAIRQTQSGTTGANSNGAAEQFKPPAGFSLDTLHAGDRVTYSLTETGGIKTISKLEKQ